jgi:hypothetical protein
VRDRLPNACATVVVMSSKVAPLEPAAEGGTFDEPLLDYESSLAGMLGEGITTVTFYEGDFSAGCAFLKERLAVVAAANPWIFARIVKEKQHGKKAALRISTTTPTVNDDVFVVNDNLKLSEAMPYGEMVKLVNGSGAKVPQGRKLLNKPLAVSKMTVVPTIEGGFAVIFSLSHTITNGSGYYQILNMLSADATVFAMDTKRRDDLRGRVNEYMGKKHYAYLNGAGMLFNALGKVLFGKEPTPYCFIVDDEKLKALRAEAKAKPGAPEKISANDVLTSSYGRVCGSRMLIMAADFKGRIDGTKLEDAAQCVHTPWDPTTTHPMGPSSLMWGSASRMASLSITPWPRTELGALGAGVLRLCRASLTHLTRRCVHGSPLTTRRYHAGMLLDEQGYGEPASIRNALTGPPPLSRCAIPSGCCASMGLKVGLITSWAALKDLQIPGCMLKLHTPCEQTTGMVVKGQEDTCIVFNPRPGKIAMLCMSKTLSGAELMAGLPFEGPLAPKMWPL